MALAGGTGVAQADDSATEPSVGNTQSRDDSPASASPGGQDSGSGDDKDGASPAGEPDAEGETAESEPEAPKPTHRTSPKKRSTHRQPANAAHTDESLTAPQVTSVRDDESSREMPTPVAAPTSVTAAVSAPAVTAEPDPAPVVAVATVIAAPEATEIATAVSSSSGGGSETPAQTPASWVALAAARRELGVAAVATIAPPLLQIPNPVTGTVAGTMAPVDPDGKKLTYKVVSPPTEGTLSFNSKTATFTYTPTTSQRVLAGLSPAPATVSFTVTASNGTTTAPLTVSLTVAPVTVTELGRVGGLDGARGVAVTNTRAYVAGTNSVTVIDTVNRTVIGSIPLAGASNVAVKPDGTRLYVTNAQAGTLTVVNTATLAVVGAPIKVGNGAAVAVVSPDGKTVYVANSLDGTVSKVSTATNKVTGTVQNVGAGAALITVSPDSKKIYVANIVTGVAAWFTSTSTTAAAIPGLSNFQPSGVAVSPDSKTLYISSADGTIAMVDTAKNTVKATFTVAGPVGAIALSKDGSLLLADNGSGNLLIISTVTRGALTTVATNTGTATAAALTLSPDGMQVYLTQAGDAALHIVSLVPPNTAPIVTTTINVPSQTGVVTGKVSATDADSPSLKLSASTPAKGKVVLSADGTFTYTPTAAARHAAAALDAPAAARTDTFMVTIDDGWRGIVSVPVTVDILAANTGPTAKYTVGKPVTTTGSVTGTVTATDKDKDALTYSAVTGGGKGTVSISSKGVFVYTPSAAARHMAAAATASAADKTDTVTVTVSDGHGGTYTLDATVTIGPKNAAPTSGGLLAGQPNSATGEVTGSVQAVDSDNDTLSYSASIAPKKGTVAVRPDGSFTYTPTQAALDAARATGAARATQTDTFTLTVQDGHGGTAAVAVSVAIVNGAPVATVPTVGAANGGTGSVTGKVVFTDPDRDKLAIATTGSLTYGTVVVKSDGTFTYTPTATARFRAAAATATVTDSFTITATDAYGAQTRVDIVVPVDPARHVVTGSATVGGSPAAVVVNRAGTRAYVTNYADGTLSVINTSNNTAVGSPIALGVLPDSITVNADGTRIYVTGLDATSYAGRVVVVDTATNKVLGSPIAVGSYPTGISVSPDGKRAYVTNGGDNTVTVIDTVTRAVVGTPIAVGKAPTGIAVTPDGRRAYVTNGGDGTVSIIDTTTGFVTGAAIAVGSMPVGVAISYDGTRAYVANSNSGTVSVIDTATNTVVGTPIAVGATPQAVTVSPDGARVYVTGAGGTLTVVDTATNAAVGSPIAVGTRPSGLATNPDGSRIYVTNSAGTLTVVSLSSTLNAPVAPATPPAATTNANGTVSGFLGVTDSTNKTYAVTVRPALGTVAVKADGSYVYTPTAAARQYASTAPVSDSFTVTVTNARGVSTAVTRTVSIAPLATTGVTPPQLGDPILMFSNEHELHRPSYVLVHPNGLRAYSINTVQTASQTYPTVTISVIDTVTNTIVGQPIYFGDQISGAVLTPNGQQLYVLRKNTGTAWVIDTASNNAVVAELAVGQSPSQIIASPDGKRVYVLSTGTDGSTPGLFVIDTASRAVVGTPITLGSDVYSTKPLVISGDSSRLVVQGTSGVDIIDTSWRTVTRRVSLPAFERGILSPDGRTLYVVAETIKILAVDTTTGSISTRISLADQGFRDIALSPDGTRIYAATTDTMLSTFDAATGALISRTALDQLAQDIAVSADGKWIYALTYFIDYTGITSSLRTLDAASNTLVGAAVPLGTLSTVLTLSPDGRRVYVPSAADSRTYVVDTGRSTQATAEVVDTSAAGLYDRLRRLTDYPWSKDGLAIEQVESSGSKRVIVYFGGAVGQLPSSSSATRGALRNLLPYLGNEVDHVITARIDEVLKDLPADTEIMLVGYSQGGMAAQNIAAAWKTENHRGVVTTVVTYGSPIVQPPGTNAQHVIHFRARHDQVPLLGAAGHAQIEAQWLLAGQIFDVIADVPLDNDLHGNLSTYADVGKQFDALPATQYSTVKADLVNFAGKLINSRRY